MFEAKFGNDALLICWGDFMIVTIYFELPLNHLYVLRLSYIFLIIVFA